MTLFDIIIRPWWRTVNDNCCIFPGRLHLHRNIGFAMDVKADHRSPISCRYYRHH